MLSALNFRVRCLEKGESAAEYPPVPSRLISNPFRFRARRVRREKNTEGDCSFALSHRSSCFGVGFRSSCCAVVIFFEWWMSALVLPSPYSNKIGVEPISDGKPPFEICSIKSISDKTTLKGKEMIVSQGCYCSFRFCIITPPPQQAPITRALPSAANERPNRRAAKLAAQGRAI